MTWTFPCPDDTCTPAGDRPYARSRKWTSVTTLIGILDKPGLSWAAAKETAIYCLNHHDELVAMDYGDAVDKARKHHSILWREAAQMGTLSHEAAMAFADGQPFTLPDDTSDEMAEQVAAFIGGLRRWWEATQPDVHAVEQVVRNDDLDLIGTMDMLAGLPDGRVALVDLKHTKRLDGDPYVADWSRQLTFYAVCDLLCHFHGKELAGEVKWADHLPVPDVGLIVNVMGDGRVRTFEFPLDAEQAYGQAAAMLAVKKFKPSFEATGEIAVPKPEPRPAMPVNPSAYLD